MSDEPVSDEPVSDRDASTVADVVHHVLSTARDGVVPIAAAGHPVLRTAALPLTNEIDSQTFSALIDVMRATMHDAPGVGLAAPQIGIPLQIAVLEDMYEVSEEVARARHRTPLPFRVIVNPRYSDVGTAQASFFEGCLSVPGYQAVVHRSATVRLDCLDHTGSPVSEMFEGWPARIVAHETDHLAGTLYIDKAETRSLSANDVYRTLWMDPTPERASESLGFDAGSSRQPT